LVGDFGTTSRFLLRACPGLVLGGPFFRARPESRKSMDKKKMSVAEMIAAARKTDAQKAEGGAAPAPTEPKAAPPTPAPAAEKPAAEKPAAAKPAPAKPAAGGARPSVAEMMAMARAQKEAAAAAPAEAKPAEKAAPSAKKESPRPAAKAPVAEAVVDTGPKETVSILSEARKEAKPGPMSKAEAAAKAPAKPAAPPAARRPVPPMPVKPDYAKPKPKPAADLDRRSVLIGIVLGSSMAIGFTSMATTFGLWLLGTARFMFPNILTEPPSKFKVGFPSNFAPGQVDTRFVAQFGVWVVNYEYNGKPEIYALRTVCTHLGCTPNWLEGEQKFKCPCHGSGFYKDGINFEGPAPRPLERYAIRVADDGQLEIDKSKLFLEEKGDWADPSSFVAV
jgi:cytochrome b6-f complex iron-sulfur subunit